jgi:glutamate-ammonia-ligase adenylyltransferase
VAPDTRHLPAGLREVARDAWARILEAAGAGEREALEASLGDPQLARQCATVLACSRFAAETLRRRPWLLPQLVESGTLQRPLHERAVADELSAAGVADEAALAVQLRRCPSSAISCASSGAT